MYTIYTDTHTPANRYTYTCIPIRLDLLAACDKQTYFLKTRQTPKYSSLTAPESLWQSASHRALTSCWCANSQQAAFLFFLFSRPFVVRELAAGRLSLLFYS